MKVPESYKKRKGKREMIKEIILEHIPDLKDTCFWIFFFKKFPVADTLNGKELH